MIEVLKKCINDGDIDNSIIIGRNLINTNPNDREAVATYVGFLCDLAENIPSFDERKDYINQASVIVAYITENASIDLGYLEEIKKMKSSIENIANKLVKEEDDRIGEIVTKIDLANSNAMKKIHSLCNDLASTTSQDEFDKLMVEISDVDNQIEKEYLSGELKQQYDILTKKCTDLISSKMKEIEHIDNVNYNQKAVEAYEKAFKEFKAKESIYKNNFDNLRGLVTTTLFKYRPDRLFNETLIYYNHVYAYIFDKLNEDGKIALTKCAIDCDRK